ncbi:unnamed protein product [Parnassius apollo]|uniref:(apollo) hypothetical protein n=1 Tax=Parnassius apollo TaxID=110799 RepID=A0A8S3X1A3_PARAO|nr:unnamed protein product [Parnassius apollo]
MHNIFKSDVSVYFDLFLVYIFIHLSVCSSIDDGNCIAPPLECPNKNITFWLYTRANRDKPHELKFSEPKSIDMAPWVPNAPIKIIIHGYTGDRNYSPNKEIRPAYLECCDYNIIAVDYNPIAREPCYVEAAFNTELIGKCSAQLIDEIVFNHGIDLSRIHVIGFSLGAHIGGFIASNIKSGRLERLTGLDPALPFFATVNVTRKIDPSDGKLVDILHTNALQKGKLEISGHVDFFANGGMTQPGCKADADLTKSGCEHARAPAYFAESITTQVGFYGTKCYSWIAYILGWCDIVGSDEDVLFGEYMPKNASGLYFFNTNAEPPYSRGRNNKTTSMII